MSDKNVFINCLISAKRSMTVKDSQDSEYLTYFTSYGIVVGKEDEITPLDIGDVDNLQKELMRRLEEKSDVSVVDIATGIYNRIFKEVEKDQKSNPQSIALTDVEILTAQSKIISVNTFVLFTDQVMGIIPGRVELSQFQLK